MAENDEIVELDCITLTLEDGTEMECAILDSFEMDGTGYVILAPIEDDDTLGKDRYIYRYEEDGEDFVIVDIESEDELKRAYDFYISLDDDED